MPKDCDYDIDALDRAIYETVHEYRNATTGKRGALGLAPVVGMQPSTLSNKANPHEEFAHLTVKESRRLMLATGDHSIGRALMRDVGEACYPLPTEEFIGDLGTLEAVTEWQAEVGETAQKVRDAYADGKIEIHEAEQVRRELIEDFEKGLEIVGKMMTQAEPESPSPAKVRAVK